MLTQTHPGLFEDEHEEFRNSFRRFLTKEIVPHHEQWERDGIVPRDIYRAAGQLGFMGMSIPEEYGGGGVDDFRFNVVIGEEVIRASASGFGLGLTLHNDVCLPYLLHLANDEQRARWLPGCVSGDTLLAIAMTEPTTGSDLAGILTRGRPTEHGWSVDGAKTFISNGINAELVITAVRTEDEPGHRGISLLAIEADMDGFERGRNLDKVGLHAQDTAELFFSGVEVPRENLLGIQGLGFKYLMQNLPQERLSIAVAAFSAAEAALGWTIEYVNERVAFGTTVGSFQNTRFQLARLATDVDVARTYLGDCIRSLVAGTLSPERAAMAKLHCSELQGRATDLGVQLHGGYGYMLEYPIARAYQDAWITRIYGGTNEVMQEIIARSIGL